MYINEETIKRFLRTVETLKYRYFTSLSEINKKIGEKCRIFIHDYSKSSNYPGIPEVSQIVIGEKFWYYQLHIAVITEVKEGGGYDYVDLTKTDNKKRVPLEWMDNVPEDKRKVILEEIEKAYVILEEILEEKREAKIRSSKKIEDEKIEAITNVLEMI